MLHVISPKGPASSIFCMTTQTVTFCCHALLLPALIFHIQRYKWVYFSRRQAESGRHKVGREQIVERNMKAKYILGEVMLRSSDKQAWSPKRLPQSLGRHVWPQAYMNTFSLLQLKAMKRTMISFFLQWLVSTLFSVGLTFWFCIYISHNI